jgi:ribosomal protein S18 acetylase RimI-like enzyme
MEVIEIIEYKSEHQPYFEKLNRAWIEKYFEMEEVDRFVLEQPEKAILENGGVIFMASCNGIMAGTVALIKEHADVFEFAKMAVDENFRRKGIAEKLSNAAVKKAMELGARKIILYSQTILVPALSLYKKIGFVQVPIDHQSPYKRPDVKMEMELHKVDFSANINEETFKPVIHK